MKRYLLLFLILSCKSPTEKYKDDLQDTKIRIMAEHMTDSIIKNIQSNSLFADTIGVESAPVKVLRARPVTKEYSNYKDISLTYKNVSGKTISAIRFKWHGINSFGEPADLKIDGGFGSGFSDTRLRAGKSETSEWSQLSRDLKTVTKAWAYEVVFEDGTKWKAGKTQ